MKIPREIGNKAGIGYNLNYYNKISAPKSSNSRSFQKSNIIYFGCKGVGHNHMNVTKEDRKIIKLRRFGFQKEPWSLTLKDPRELG